MGLDCGKCKSNQKSRKGYCQKWVNTKEPNCKWERSKRLRKSKTIHTQTMSGVSVTKGWAKKRWPNKDYARCHTNSRRDGSSVAREMRQRICTLALFSLFSLLLISFVTHTIWETLFFFILFFFSFFFDYFPPFFPLLLKQHVSFTSTQRSHKDKYAMSRQHSTSYSR